MAKQTAWPILPTPALPGQVPAVCAPSTVRPRSPWRTVDRRTLSLVGPSSRVSVWSDRLTAQVGNAKAVVPAVRIAGRRAVGAGARQGVARGAPRWLRHVLLDRAKDSYEFFRRVLTTIESGVRKTMVVGPVSYGGRP
ncbi:hypothetical protein GCM10010505_48510 [Kitasatospora aburaviensis]